MNQKLLIVDDDEEIRTQMKWGLAQDYEVSWRRTAPSALENFQAVIVPGGVDGLGIAAASEQPRGGFGGVVGIVGAGTAGQGRGHHGSG